MFPRFGIGSRSGDAGPGTGEAGLSGAASASAAPCRAGSTHCGSGSAGNAGPSGGGGLMAQTHVASHLLAAAHQVHMDLADLLFMAVTDARAASGLFRVFAFLLAALQAFDLSEDYEVIVVLVRIKATAFAVFSTIDQAPHALSSPERDFQLFAKGIQQPVW